MRRIGKAGATRKGERLCIHCKIDKISKRIAIDYKGQQTWQQFEFRVCRAEGKASSLRSPEKPPQGPADRRVKRDWHNVRKVIDETTPDSEKGKVARAMELTQ